MNETTYRIAAIGFVGVGIFLVIYSWPPGYGTLQEEEAKIVRIVSHPGARYNVKIVTRGGAILSCVENALRNWPPDSINRCPVEKFRPFVGRSVKVLHDGKYFYNVEVNGNTVLSYRAFRNIQVIMDFVALIMVVIGIIAWRRANFSN